MNRETDIQKNNNKKYHNNMKKRNIITIIGICFMIAGCIYYATAPYKYSAAYNLGVYQYLDPLACLFILSTIGISIIYISNISNTSSPKSDLVYEKNDNHSNTKKEKNKKELISNQKRKEGYSSYHRIPLILVKGVRIVLFIVAFYFFCHACWHLKCEIECESYEKEYYSKAYNIKELNDVKGKYMELAAYAHHEAMYEDLFYGLLAGIIGLVIYICRRKEGYGYVN